MTQQPPESEDWRPGWVKLSTRGAYFWGMLIGTLNVFFWKDPGTYGWSLALITFGMGLSASASKAFRK